MQKTELIAFRATPAQREKLIRLAMGEGCSMTGVIARLIEQTPVKEVSRTITGLQFATAAKQNKSAVQVSQATTGAFAN